jgi:putative intracellular protease/amidase
MSPSDVFGPLDILNTLGRERTIRLSIIAATLDPVSTRPPSNMTHSSPQFAESIVPTHTFETAPKDLEVLIVPGGMYTPNCSRLKTRKFVMDDSDGRLKAWEPATLKT